MPTRTKVEPKKAVAPTPAAPPVLPQSHNSPVADRMAQGKALRDRCSRKSHAAWKPPAKRADPIELLIENSRGRLEDLVPIRYGRMMANPFAFYRGAAAIMASDLSHTPATGLMVQACGDCHLVNFGGFATAERKIIFDINDFDETSIAPWEWDVKRLTTSFVVAGRSNGFSAADCQETARQVAESYRMKLAEYSQKPVLEVWYDSFDFDQIIHNLPDKQMRKFYLKKLDAAAEQRAHEKEFAKLAFASGETPRIIDQPPLIYHITGVDEAQQRAQWEASLADYLKSLPSERRVLLDRYKLTDAAIKVVGVGSVGTFCGIALLMSGKGDPLFLQFKQARQSVLEPYAGASPFTHAGQRVVVGQRLMQAASDMFLGWYTGQGREARQFYVRQLADAKIKPVIEIMKPQNLLNYAQLCGWALARAHARSGDAAVLSGYLGTSTAFEDAIVTFSEAYADQNERDHAALVAAVRAGKVEARQVE
ncbi:MAG TPA: DUF2252 domain-containing protein [Anaerolineae bacterium]|nr:DUF2252 domain-containing protein [Anaerolineae bacterium]